MFKLNQQEILERSLCSKDTIFNPCATWRTYPYSTQNVKIKKAWNLTYTKDDSKMIVAQELEGHHKSTNKSPYAVIRARNSSLISETARNTKPLSDYKHLINIIIELGLKIVVLGVIPQNSKYRNPNVIYINELGPVTDDGDLQIHFINGAIGLIESPCGITHLTYCTETPTLYFDMPFHIAIRIAI